MMQEDLISSLTRQVKEEVIENYLLERRILDLQIENLQEQAERTRESAGETGERLACLASLMVRSEMLSGLREFLCLGNGCFWTTCLEEGLPRKAWKTRPIPVRAFTRKARFRKLVAQCYRLLFEKMREYGRLYRELGEECQAVNININAFHKNFDLLSILNFLRSLDMPGLEKKRILGENFTAKEMAALDKSLYILPQSLEKFGVPVPIEIPEPRLAEARLDALSGEVYRRCEKEVREILQ